MAGTMLIDNFGLFCRKICIQGYKSVSCWFEHKKTIGDILHHYDASRIDLLKLDIEGSELELFGKETANWLDRVEIIAVKLHDRFRPGCAHALYSSLAPRTFVQEIRGETIFIKISGADRH